MRRTTPEGDVEAVRVRNLYIADGEMRQRDSFLNSDLGAVAYVGPEEGAATD